MTTGIYSLNFIGTDKVYIGKGKSIEGRFSDHLRKLLKGTHSAKLNKAYKDFGIPKLEILIECEYHELNFNENETIQIFNAVDNGFNTLYNAEDMPDGSNTPGELHYNSKYSNDQVVLAFIHLLEEPTAPFHIIAEICGLTKAVVASISCGASHTWLSKEFPDKYQILLGKINSTSRKEYRRCAEAQNIDYPLIESPKGIKYNVTNTCEFARIHGLDQGHLQKVLTCIRRSHKGWKLFNTTKKEDNIMSWTDEQKQSAIAAYEAGNPTPANSTELVKEIAENMEQSANGVRMVLVQAGVYLKKDATATAGTKGTGTAKTGDKAPRVSKESQIAELTAAIEAKGSEVDMEILSKLTGKAAAYFTKVLVS